MNSDLVSLIVENENEIVKLQRVVGGKAPVTTNLDMGGYRILNVAHPRDPSKKTLKVTSLQPKFFMITLYMFKVDQNYIRRDKDGSLDGRLDLSNHRINGLADPTDADDAVTSRYVASRFQALIDDVQDKKSKLDALQNLFGVENNQVLIREYEIIGGTNNIAHDSIISLSRINGLDFINIFTLKEYFLHLYEEPVDNVTWLRIKQPGTYNLHFDLILHDLISNTFSFELHTRDEIIHFSEHNPKHDINLEKGENCILVYKNMFNFQIQTGSKIYVYYNI